MSQDVTKLKELLFDDENRAITNMAHRLDTVFARSGTEERFRSSVADVLDGALRDAEVEHHQALADAISPLIVRTIKTEITNSQDELAEALYPMTGRMVKSYVASAIKDLTNQINRSVERNPLMMRVNSLITGRSVAELALADAQALNVEELYLIKRGSGELVARWPKDLASANRDQVMSGILTAINEFAIEAFQSQGTSLRQIDLGDAQVYLRGSPTYLLAAKCTGTAAAPVEQTIDDEFLSAIEKHHDLDYNPDNTKPVEADDVTQKKHASVLTELATQLNSRIDTYYQDNAASGATSSPVKTLLWVFGMTLAAWLGWTTFNTFLMQRTHTKTAYMLRTTDEMSGYPTTIDTAAYGTAVTIEGLAPTPQAKQTVIENIRAMIPAVKVNDQLTVVKPILPDYSPEFTTIKSKFDGLTTQVTTLDSGVTKRIETLDGRLNTEAITRATARARARLNASLPDLRSLSENLDNAQAKADVEKVRSNMSALIPLIEAQLKTASNQNSSSVELANMKPSLSDLATRIDIATQKIAPTLITERMDTHALNETVRDIKNAPRPSAQNLSLSETAENLALRAEHFATLTAATSQALRMKIVTTPRERLQAWARANAIFFGKDAEFRNPERALKKVERLARLIKDSNNNVRIIGFTDVQGNQEINYQLSLTRAGKIRSLLISKGVSANLLGVVGRQDAKELSLVVGELSPNRRVEFEIGFIDERTR